MTLSNFACVTCDAGVATLTLAFSLGVFGQEAERILHARMDAGMTESDHCRRFVT